MYWYYIVCVLSAPIYLDAATFYVKEEQPVNTYVGKSSVNGSNYSKNDENDENAKNFIVNSKDGTIRTNIVLDREKLDKEYQKSGFKFSIVIDETRAENIVVIIVDINDNVPFFKNSIENIFLSEDVKLNTNQYFPAAADFDKGTNAITDYNIVSGDQFKNFKVHVASTNDQRHEPYLSVVALLDREDQTANILLNISACDHQNKLCSYGTINITVLDVNDHKPVFTQNFYSTDVKENAEIGHVVIQLLATDRDEGSNAQITYKVHKNEQFSIHPNTGKVFVSRRLDAEKRTSIIIMVVASDHGNPSLSSLIHVTIGIIDCNDNRPEILPKYEVTGKYNVLEGAKVNTKAVSLSVIDRDVDEENKKVTVRLYGKQSYFELRHEKLNLYGIYVIKEIDRELTPKFNIKVRATDSGSPALHTDLDIPLNVGDVNDNAPKFSQALYDVIVNESEPINFVLLRVAATDEDLGQNRKLFYNIVSDSSNGYFQINFLGQIYIHKTLDHEIFSSAVLNISVKDGGLPPLYQYAKVNINVLDVNDNDPYFDTTNVVFKVRENNKKGIFIGRVIAHDKDIIGTPQLHYKLNDVNFHINTSTGVITAKKSFDREKLNVFNFKVYAIDGGNRTGSIHVSIHILDVNDERPMFRKSVYNLSIHENFPVGEIAVYVSAVDLDEEENAQLRYTATFKGNMFSIDRKTGGIILHRDLRLQRKKKFSFSVQVQDTGGLKAEKAAKVYLNVLKASNQAPQFEHAKYHFIVDENNQVNQVIGKIVAKRPSSQSTTFMEYHITSGNIGNTFHINKFGQVSAVKILDHEAVHQFILHVQAIDTLDRRLRSNASVTITINDLNDNAPQFSVSDNHVVKVQEGVPVGHVLFQCHVIDRDSGKNGMVQFTMLNVTGPFSIRNGTGEVFTTGSLDYEAIKGFDIYLKVSDMGDRQLSSQVRLAIVILDINDNPPVFSNQYSLHVKENLNVGLPITNITATDADSGSNGMLFYKLTPSADSHYFFLNNGGELHLKEKLDRELKDHYDIQISAYDKGTPWQKGDTWVRIIVDDINDETPTFEKPSYNFELREELPVGTVIGEITVNDRDIGSNSDITCSLLKQDANFKISTKKNLKNSVCIIASGKSFDREADKESFTLMVVAVDHGHPSKSSRVVVQVHIRNINDHPPKFSQNVPYLACVAESSPKGTLITQIGAKDNDAVPVPLMFSLITLPSDTKDSLKYFNINPTNGKVRTKVKINSPTNDVYNVTIQVLETGTGGWANYQKLVIFIVPSKPLTIFKHVCAQQSIREDISPFSKNAVFSHLFAYDTMYTIQNYSFVNPSGGTSELPFKILANTGIVTLTSSLHYQSKPFYRLNVTADGARNNVLHSDYITFIVFVIPNNSDSPEYVRNPERFVVGEDWPPNKYFGELQQAFDKDEGMEGYCMFSIVETSPVDAPIYISPLNRTIMFTRPIDRETIEQYVVKVRITDLALDENNRLSQTFAVYILIRDINDNKPLFVSSNQATVMENARIGDTIMTIKAEDPDKGVTNTAIVYKILSGNVPDSFKLNSDTGELTVQKVLNIYQVDQYRLTVLASEKRDTTSLKNIPSLNSTLVVSVTILDINDKVPKFTQDIYRAVVKENLPTGSFLLQVNSTDEDINPLYKQVVYELLDGHDTFSVDSRTGIITTRTVHDREQRSSFQISLSVKNIEDNGHENICSVLITIADENDFAPVFPDGTKILLRIPENLPPPFPLHTFITTDQDIGSNAQVEFSISQFFGSSSFQLNQTTGQITVVKPLDREEYDQYSFVITAHNTNPPNHQSTQNVTIMVDDMNDEKPVFQKKVYKISVDENKDLNSTVLTVKAIDKDLGNNAIVLYSIIAETDLCPFTIDQKTGDLILVGPLDYENITSYRLRVNASGPGGNFHDIAAVEVKVVDQNDNFPIFNQMVYSVTAKRIQTSQPVLVVHAVDADEDGKQRISYSFESPANGFSIDPDTGEISISDSRLIRGHYRLHVKAKDIPAQHRGYPYPSKENFVTVLITIGNPTDSSLRFLNKSAFFEIPENTLNFTKLGYIKAIDTQNKQIYYSITEGSNPEYAFGVRNNGELYVNNSAAVDYETQSSFFLGVLAITDYSTNAEQSVFLSVLINLIDLNDNTPVILPNNQTFYYPETLEKNFQPTLVHYFHVSDKDKRDQGKLKLEIISGNENDVFAVYKWKHLYLSKSIDFEQKRKYHLVIRVTDGGDPVRYNDSHIYINVEDQNDNPPVLTHIQDVSINEASAIGTVVANVTATDVDITSSVFRYGLHGNISVFQIDEFTGAITLIKRIDYESQKIYVLNVSAFDGVFTSFGNLTVHVTDANDNVPQFTQSVYLVNVSSTLKNNKHIVKVMAKDLDSGAFGRVQYRIGNPEDAFTIEQNSGNIFTNKDFSFNQNDIDYSLLVTAYDNNGQPTSRSSSAMVKLLITGKRSQDPVFRKSIYDMKMVELASLGANVGEVLATFPSGAHKVVEYRITKGNINNAFKISPITGSITVNNDLDREKRNEYFLDVVADVVGEHLSATCHVRIKIEDANDNSPVFTKKSYHLSIKEDVEIGYKLEQLNATDADEGENQKIKYEIYSGQDKHDWLRIHPETGWLTTNAKLDREQISQIQLTIKAEDRNGVNGRRKYASLNLTLLDVNDNYPKFILNLPLKDFTVKENETIGSMALKVTARDLDEGDNGRVSYRIINSTGMGKFVMKDKDSGWVYTNQVLNYEEQNSYNLSVVAYDHGNPSYEASFEYRISVEDVNEFLPVFRKTNYEFQVRADAPISTPIGKVEATDDDGGSAGEIFYSFAEPSAEFSIGRKGIILVLSDLRESKKAPRVKRDLQKSPFSLKVLANNGPGTPSTSVDIDVLVNFTCLDCAPRTTVAPLPADSMNRSTLVIVLTSVSVLVVILLLLVTAMYCKHKKGCLRKTTDTPARFYAPKKESHEPSSSIERELLNSNDSSFDRLHFYKECSSKPETHLSSEAGHIQGSGTVRSVSATDKASTYSFGIYHDQAVPESEMQPFSDTLSSVSLKDLEQESVFRYSPKKGKKTSRSCLSRSTQESSLYSLTSNQPNGKFNLTPPKKNTILSAGRGSHESLNDFQEEGGGEAAGGIDVGNLLYAKLSEVEEEEQDAVMDGVRSFHEEGALSHGGSLSTIIGSDEDLRRDYKANYLNQWGPQFKPVNSVFSELKNGLRKNKARDTNKKSDANLQNDIALQVLNSGRASLSSAPSLPRTPVEIPSTYTSGALSPNFTPSLTPLVFRSPSVSSVGTHDNYTGNGAALSTFQIGLNNGLLRSESIGSQLSRITLSDISVSEDEKEI